MKEEKRKRSDEDPKVLREVEKVRQHGWGSVTVKVVKHEVRKIESTTITH